LCDDDARLQLRALLKEQSSDIGVTGGSALGATVVKTCVAGRGRIDGARATAPWRVSGPRWQGHRTWRFVPHRPSPTTGHAVAADPLGWAALPRIVADGVPVMWDPKPREPAPLTDVTVATRDLAEPPAVARFDGTPDQVTAAVLRYWSPRAAALTWGPGGAVLATAGPSDTHIIGAPHAHGGDRCGAGHVFASRPAAALGDALAPMDALRCAVDRAARFVGEGGAGAFARSDRRSRDVNVVARVRTPSTVGQLCVLLDRRRVGVAAEHGPPQLSECPWQQTGDVHLGDADLLRDLALRAAAVEAQQHDPPLPLGQAIEQRTQHVDVLDMPELGVVATKGIR
jgi:hypothetical protein